MESERVSKAPTRGGLGLTVQVCPKCRSESYFDMREQVAWCWATGLIEIGDALPADGPDGGGAIEIARGPKFALKGQLAALARHGIGASEGCLLVPGVPEADDQEAKGDALSAFLYRCNRRTPKDGVVFAKAFA